MTGLSSNQIVREDLIKSGGDEAASLTKFSLCVIERKSPAEAGVAKFMSCSKTEKSPLSLK
jgi:hypothetical protein